MTQLCGVRPPHSRTAGYTDAHESSIAPAMAAVSASLATACSLASRMAPGSSTQPSAEWPTPYLLKTPRPLTRGTEIFVALVDSGASPGARATELVLSTPNRAKNPAVGE